MKRSSDIYSPFGLIFNGNFDFSPSGSTANLLPKKVELEYTSIPYPLQKKTNHWSGHTNKRDLQIKKKSYVNYFFFYQSRYQFNVFQYFVAELNNIMYKCIFL